ncbi:MAG: N-acetylmuramoyl-L-alanine amidase [Gemmatimonadota bacterium]|nr:N-acetylmuramoyl-L-alanine amidase [Gemmatimonadota bacterium]
MRSQAKARTLALGVVLLPLVLAGERTTANASGAGSSGGVIDIEVRYPARHQLIVPDSNFIFGSVGSGGVALEIDGHPVTVEGNGAFLAWLPVPDAGRGDTAAYMLRAVEGPDTATAVLSILRPPSRPPSGSETPWLLTTPLERPSDRWYEPGGEFALSVLGEGGAEVELAAGNRRFPLRDLGPERGSLHRYAGRIDAAALHAAACEAGDCRSGTTALPTGEGDSIFVAIDTVTAGLVARSGADVTRSPVSFHLAPRPDPAPGIKLVEAEDPVNGQSGVVVGRPTAFGPYRWRFPEGTVARVATRVGSRVALDLGGGLRAWVASEDILWEPDPLPETPARAFGGRAEPAGGRIDFRVGLSHAAPARVVQTGPRAIRLTVYGAVGEMDRIALGAATGVTAIDWVQEAPSRLHIDLELDWPIWGHRLSIEHGDPRAYEGPRTSAPRPADSPAGGVVLRLAIRRPPPIDPAAPLRGRRIAVDPGHPGAGSYGPTGYYEGDANLAVARRLASLLEAAGARPILVRDGRRAVGLYERTLRAREEDAELFVSIHNNAVPDGVRPFDVAGTSTFYYHRHSAALAREVQDGMVRQMGLRDLGPLWGDLAVVREPWMPAILTEGAFMMVPAQEAALRTPEFQERYARGVLEGIEAYLREFTERMP